MPGSAREPLRKWAAHEQLWRGMRGSLLDAHLNSSSSSSTDRAIRCDGRAYDELREITAALDVLPSVHGSSLFRRGNTEVCVCA